MESSNIPLCPITQQPLRDPVIDPEGNTYERSAILDWLSRNPNSPLTRTPLTPNMLVTNRAMRDLIESKQSVRPIIPETIQASAPILKQEGPDSIEFTCWSTADPAYYGFHIRGPDTEYSLQPVHICCVIDISGSMEDPAAVPGSGSESNGMTILSLVKHATRTVLESLGPNDRLSIVSFSDEAIVELKAKAMDSAGKSMARDVLDRLQPFNSTNLAAGVLTGIEAAHAVTADRSHFTSIFLLTDGVPNDQQLDYSGIMRRQFRKFPLFGSFHTFGFGYNLNGQLLRTISKEGDGAFSFIPDAGMVGTVFINAIANIRTVYAVRPRLTLPLVDGITVVGDYRVDLDKSTGLMTIYLPSLRYGQSADVLVHYPKEPSPSGLDQCSLIADNLSEEFTMKPKHADKELFKPQILFHIARANSSVHMFKTSESADKRAQDAIAEICSHSQQHRATIEPLNALCEDLAGQVAMAFSRDDWYQRWGRHYLISVAFAHMHQICNNFKDPGVQVYGKGLLFKKLQEELNDLFLTLPPPPRGYGASLTGSFSMAAYNNSAGVCFHPSTLIRLADGTSVTISRLRQGDIVQTGESQSTRVKCIVFNHLSEGGCWMIPVSKNLWLTEYHPVLTANTTEWQFARDFATERFFIPTHFVCNLVLESVHSILFDDGIQCCTLGHGISSDSVIRHEYFGTDAVIRDLSKLHGWNEGRVIISNQQVRRSQKTGRICEIINCDTYNIH